MRQMKARPQGFTIVKQGIAFHSQMKPRSPDFFYGERGRAGPRHARPRGC